MTPICWSVHVVVGRSTPVERHLTGALGGAESQPLIVNALVPIPVPAYGFETAKSCGVVGVDRETTSRR